MGKDNSQMNKSSGKQMKRCANSQVATMNMQIIVTTRLSLYMHQTDKIKELEHLLLAGML